MNRIAIAAAIACAATLGGTPALADKGGSCHFHGSKPATEDTVLTCAAKRKDALAGSGKIATSWKDIKQPEQVEQVDGRKGKEWKVTYSNPSVADKDKQKLYVFLSLPGNVLAANHSGR